VPADDMMAARCNRSWDSARPRGPVRLLCYRGIIWRERGTNDGAGKAEIAEIAEIQIVLEFAHFAQFPQAPAKDAPPFRCVTLTAISIDRPNVRR